MNYSSKKIAVANQILSLFTSNSTQFKIQHDVLSVSWINHRGTVIHKLWRTIPKSDSFPSFHHEWAQGGTCCIALCHLARWIQGRNVLPLSAWKKWISNGLGQSKADLILAILREAGYPASSECIKCHIPIEGGFGWYGYGKDSGCGHFKCSEIE